MMNARNVPKRFWPEAVKWATHVMNRSPTLSVKNSTPEEAWSGAKPAVQYFRTFGCIAHVHVNDVQRKKLDTKSKICVLLGISDESKAYKLYDPIDKRIIVSRDVVFEEAKGWNWDNTQKLVQQGNSADSLGDIDEGSKHEVAAANNEENDNNATVNDDNVIVEETSSDSENEYFNSPSPQQPRIRKPSVRLNDYVTEQDEEFHNLAVFNSCEDPSTYHEAVKIDVHQRKQYMGANYLACRT
jgi:hypothetical protein